MLTTGLELGHAFRAAHVGVEHNADRHANDEVRAVVVDAVHFDHPIVAGLTLHAQVELLHHGVLDAVVDDVNTFGRAGAGE